MNGEYGAEGSDDGSCVQGSHVHVMWAVLVCAQSFPLPLGCAIELWLGGKQQAPTISMERG